MTRKNPQPECIDCEPRPGTPRPIDKRSGPRSPRCYTHIEAKLKRQRLAARDRHQRTTYELEPEDIRELDSAQGFRCPCGKAIKHTDHDHARARLLCEHDPKYGCKRCVRGRMCFVCNTYILGRGYDIPALEAIINYLRDPPARQIWGD